MRGTMTHRTMAGAWFRGNPRRFGGLADTPFRTSAVCQFAVIRVQWLYVGSGSAPVL